jgi:hypothetical protein
LLSFQECPRTDKQRARVARNQAKLYEALFKQLKRTIPRPRVNFGEEDRRAASDMALGALAILFAYTRLLEERLAIAKLRGYTGNPYEGFK